MGTTAERTDPKLWEKVKREITNSDKGGDRGQWSARKAQLAVQEYKRRGGGYSGSKSSDNSLKQWTREEWGTRSGGKSTDTGERYLPKKARQALSQEEHARTTAKKRADTAKGRQFSSQPKDVADKTARYRRDGGAAGEPAKAELLERACRKGIDGRPAMSRHELMAAVEAGSSANGVTGAPHPSREEGGAEPSKRDLDDAAKVLRVQGRSRLSKRDLRKAVADALKEADPEDLRKADLRDMALAFGVEGTSRMTKGDLHEAVRSALS